MITTAGMGVDVVTSTVRSLVDLANEDFGNRLHYREWGFNEYDGSSTDEQIQGMASVGPAVLTVESQRFGDSTRYRDYPASITYRKYTQDVEVSAEVMHWLNKSLGRRNDLSGRNLVNWANGIASGLNYVVDLDAAKLFFLGFGTTFFSGGDGLSLFNGSHLIRKGGTQSNLFSDTHRAFTADNLVEALRRMNRFKGANGQQLMPVQHARVLCSSERAAEVWRVLNSDFGPLTANTGLNYASSAAFNGINGGTLDMKVIDKMPEGYSDYWFVVSMDRAAERQYVGWGWKPQLDSEPEKVRGSLHYLGSVYFGITCLGWQHVFGSKGDGSAV